MSVSPTHSKFGIRIQELRKQKGFTQEDLADLMSVDRSLYGFHGEAREIQNLISS